jgi:DNA-binding CsgD family transcriptional regulator
MVQGRAASNVVQARAEVAARLFALGLKPQRIATLMKRDRETVLNYLRKATATQRGD